jgi:DNA-binding response OmpR family regulator
MSASSRENATPYLRLAPDPDALPDGVRLRVALDVLTAMVQDCVPALEARTPSSRLRIDNVHVNADGIAEVVGGGDHSGAHVLLWEVLAARAAPEGRLPRVHDVVDEIDPDVDDVMSAAIDQRIASIDELFEALESAGGARVASHTVVGELARVALGLSPAVAPPEPPAAPEPERSVAAPVTDPEPSAAPSVAKPEPAHEPSVAAPEPEPSVAEPVLAERAPELEPTVAELEPSVAAPELEPTVAEPEPSVAAPEPEQTVAAAVLAEPAPDPEPRVTAPSEAPASSSDAPTLARDAPSLPEAAAMAPLSGLAADLEPVAATPAPLDAVAPDSAAPSSIAFGEPDIAPSLPLGPAFAAPEDVVDAERISVTPALADVEPRSWRDGALSTAPTQAASWPAAATDEAPLADDDAWSTALTLPPEVGLTPDMRATALTPPTPEPPSVAPYLGEPVDAEPIELELDLDPEPSERPSDVAATLAPAGALAPAATSDGAAVLPATPTPPPRESQTRISAHASRAGGDVVVGPAAPVVLLVAPGRNAALVSAVERSGHRVMWCALTDAERVVAGERPAAVVLDAWEDATTLPGPSDAGYEFVRWMRTAGSDVATIPLLLITPPVAPNIGADPANASAQHLAGFLVGADVCLGRPYDADELVAQVDALLRMSTRLRATRAALRSRPVAKAFEGNLAQVSIATLLSVLEMERRTGIFEVVAPGRRAEIHFEDGAAVRGRTQGLAVAPLEALESMLCCERGRFSFLPQPLPEEPPVRGVGIGELLLEALRRRDEQERDATNQSSAGGATH